MQINTEMSPLTEMICETAVKTLYQAGKIRCIKFVREISYLSLKESKDFVEFVMTKNNLSFPISDWENEQLVRKLRIENDSIKGQLRSIVEGY